MTTEALYCVVPAAGRGARMGGDLPKQYLPLAGKPLLQHTLERLLGHPRIAGVVVALAAADPYWPALRLPAGKPLLTVTGGSERADSVLAGLHRLLELGVPATQCVLVHDAARPCLRHADITRLIELAVPAGGGLLAVPLRDTLKRADAQQRCIATEPRESRWRAQTPQLFPLGALRAALEAAQRAQCIVTDEAMAMELAGQYPLLVEGSEDNLKVTTPADLVVAEHLLAGSDAGPVWAVGRGAADGAR